MNPHATGTLPRIRGVGGALDKDVFFAGDVVLDPFAGTGTTALAALLTGPNSMSVEIEREYFDMAAQRMREAGWMPREVGASRAWVISE